MLPYDLHNYPISIIQYSCDFVSGPVSYRVSFYLSSSETELEGWSSHSPFLYMYMLGFFPIFLPFLRDQSVILLFFYCDYYNNLFVDGEGGYN